MEKMGVVNSVKIYNIGFKIEIINYEYFQYITSVIFYKAPSQSVTKKKTKISTALMECFKECIHKFYCFLIIFKRKNFLGDMKSFINQYLLNLRIIIKSKLRL